MSPTLAMAPSPEVLFQLRAAESATLLVLLLGAPLLKGPTPPHATTNGVSEITTVVRAVKTPRRQLVVFLLSLAALTAFLDGSVTVGLAVIKHVFETNLPPWKGTEFHSVALLVAFAGFAIIGAFKEARGAPIWQSKLLKLFVFAALAFDVALAILIPLVVPIWHSKQSTGKFSNMYLHPLVLQCTRTRTRMFPTVRSTYLLELLLQFISA
ncbi:hypothetical protein AG1IA_00881 [Rhizoctonia solani AG-1 IA]|uniref:Uncharacterized protein n=1 Tax=Thanatephorus cucumeris (strain AG1-IA) TaxID=983506 RepID=L8X4E4_THACA|nr:hypothetical protein AG1IA_00881 [Rhizoctonia solani AG-1 IA]